jgi:hypothetical protein
LEQGEEPSILAAFFHDENSFSLADDFDATIDWGDGTVTENAAVSRVEAGSFFIRGKHTYNSIGSYPIRIEVSDEGQSTAETTATAIVTGARLTGNSIEINPVRGVPFNGVVASFYDANSFSNAGQFTATVDWGDGFRSSADVVFVEQSQHDGEVANLFHVRSQHTYYEAADYTVRVDVHDAASATTAFSDAFVLFLDMEVLGEDSV